MSDSNPAGWLPDPSGKHDHRYWDGTQWTDNVSDAGVASTDPFDPTAAAGADATAVDASAAEQPTVADTPAVEPSAPGPDATSTWPAAAPGAAGGPPPYTP